jgi:plasmid replication initiation protein
MGLPIVVATDHDSHQIILDEAGDRNVSMSNRLARSAQNLNLVEKRLIALGLANTDSMKPQKAGTNSGWKVNLSAREYAEVFDVAANTAYEQLKSAAENIFERYVRYVSTDRGKLEEHKFRWVSSATYIPGEGRVEMNFSPEIAPHLLGLRSHFTSYKLRHAAGLDTVYAWRLFELLSSWKSTGFYTCRIEEFWDAMEVPISLRKDFKGLRVRVIEPAVASLEAKAAMLIKWKRVNAPGSRRVAVLEFRFSPDPQGRLAIDELQPARQPALASVS